MDVTTGPRGRTGVRDGSHRPAGDILGPDRPAGDILGPDRPAGDPLEGHR